MSSVSLRWCLGLTVASLAACASTPQASGERIEVIYRARLTGLQQTLVTPSVVSAEDAYTRHKAGPGFKVADPEAVQALVRQFRDSNFFEKAGPGAVDDGAETLSLTINGRTLTLTKPDRDQFAQRPDDVRSFVTCKTAFIVAFNATDSFSSVGNIDSDRLRLQRNTFRQTPSVQPLPAGRPRDVHTVDQGRGEIEDVGRQRPGVKQQP